MALSTSTTTETKDPATTLVEAIVNEALELRRLAKMGRCSPVQRDYLMQARAVEDALAAAMLSVRDHTPRG